MQLMVSDSECIHGGGFYAGCGVSQIPSIINAERGVFCLADETILSCSH